jgi:hypothetical protein
MKANTHHARRVYTALLHLYPAEFRRCYSHELTLLFVDMHRAAAAQGTPSVIDLWLHACADLVFTALRERFMERSRVMFSPKVILWGGVAGVFGGLFWLMALSSGGTPIVLALVLGLGGLASLYSRQAGQGGRLGLAGFALGIIGTVLTLAALWRAYTNIFVGSTIGEINESVERAPALAAQGVLFILLAVAILGIGLGLLGVASLRAKTLHRWGGLPLGLGLLNIMFAISGWLIFYVPLSQGRNPWRPWTPELYVLPSVVSVLLGLGWMVLGTILAAEADSSVAQAPAGST